MKCTRPILVSDGEVYLESFEWMQGKEYILTRGDLMRVEIIQNLMRSQLRHSTVRQLIYDKIGTWEGQNQLLVTSISLDLLTEKGVSM